MNKEKILYRVHPSVKMMQKWIESLEDKTGKTLEEWKKFIEEKGPSSEKERRIWLEQENQIGRNAAFWLAEYSVGKSLEGDPQAYLQAAEGYVEALFSGARAALRPLYQELLEICLALGEDVQASPCKTIVPLYRKHVFAQLKPTTQTRLDLGLALKTEKCAGRLIDTGGLAKKDRITHRIPITTLADIDAEVKYWLKIAYQLDSI